MIYFWCLSFLYFQLDFLCHVKSNFIADWVLRFLLFAFSGSPWQTGTESDSFFESSSGDFHKTGTMLTGCFPLLFPPLHLYICICVFVYLYWPNKGFFYKHNFSNFFYQTQNFSLNVCFISFRVLWKWQLVDPFKVLMILENFLWKAPSDAFCNFAKMFLPASLLRKKGNKKKNKKKNSPDGH